MNKKGQFYLIAALVISTIVIGLVVVSNYIQKDEFVRIDNLDEEIKIESASLLDYGLYNDLSEASFQSTFSNFTDNYVENYGNNQDIYFLFGSQSNITLKGKQESDGEVILGNGTINISVSSGSDSFLGNIIPASNKVYVYLKSKEYAFDLNTNKNFYYIIVEKIGNSEYIKTG